MKAKPQQQTSEVSRILETFRFWDEEDYEYEIFPILSSAHARTTVILAGKCGSRRLSTTSFSETSFNGDKRVKFEVEKDTIKLSGVSYFKRIGEKT